MGDDIICDVKKKCLSYGKRCYRCRRNKGKKDYFEPEGEPWEKWPSCYRPWIIWGI